MTAAPPAPPTAADATAPSRAPPVREVGPALLPPFLPQGGVRVVGAAAAGAEEEEGGGVSGNGAAADPVCRAAVRHRPRDQHPVPHRPGVCWQQISSLSPTTPRL
uniref:Uncharacterized protein n=1 Tax=Arundo donax TaxID=35708 RepID=A0A0A9CN58_ARUDO